MLSPLYACEQSVELLFGDLSLGRQRRRLLGRRANKDEVDCALHVHHHGQLAHLGNELSSGYPEHLQELGVLPDWGSGPLRTVRPLAVGDEFAGVLMDHTEFPVPCDSEYPVRLDQIGVEDPYEDRSGIVVRVDCDAF